jgi:hypothetical protein
VPADIGTDGPAHILEGFELATLMLNSLKSLSDVDKPLTWLAHEGSLN